MKKLICILFAAALLAGCYKDDINSLKKDVKNLKEQMAQYESLLDALNKRLYITSYETKDGSYLITMSDGTKLTVRNTSAFITIGENGNWWIDGVDSGHSAKGEQGSAPTITIGSNGHWIINGEDTGVASHGQSGQAGSSASEIISISLVNGVMTFTFSDGRTINIQASAPEITIVEPAGGFVLDKMKWVRISPQIGSSSGATYSWLLDGEEVATDKDLLYIFATAGTYTFQLKATNGVGTTTRSVTVTINDKIYTNWTTEVYDFMRAPGQYANGLPTWTAGDDAAAMLAKVKTALTSKSLVSLGGYGGYVVMGFDHTIVNKPNGKDFIVNGNAFSSWGEPGVIEVSYDANGNDLPDDEWYEIAGSEYNKPTAVHGYKITYYNPTTDTERAEGTAASSVRWTDNKGGNGYLVGGLYKWPGWAGDKIILGGSFYQLKVNEGGIITTTPFDYGYADNWPNNDERAQIDIDWAVKSDGTPAKMKGVDFIKVYTGVSHYAGALGEISTEITGVKDLNLP